MGKTITIEYVDINGNHTLREIEPLEISDGDMLHAYCHLRGDWRHFRIRRIQSIIDSDGVIHDDPWEFFGIEPVDDLSFPSSAARPVFSWEKKRPTQQATFHISRDIDRKLEDADKNLAIARELLKDSSPEDDAISFKAILKAIFHLAGFAYLVYFIIRHFL